MNAYELGIVEGMEKVASKATDAAIGATTGSMLGWEIAKDHGMKKGKGALLGAALAVPTAVYLGPKIRKKMRKEAERSGGVPMVSGAKMTKAPKPKETENAAGDPQEMGMGAFTMRRGGEIQKTIPNQQPPRPPRY